MTAPASDLQRTIFAALGAATAVTALVGGRVFDHAPANVAFPYVTFGQTSIYDWSTGTEVGSEHLFTLHVWSKARGKKEALEVMDAARQALEAPALQLDDHHLVNLRLEFSDVRYDEDLSVYHGLLRFRAVIDS